MDCNNSLLDITLRMSITILHLIGTFLLKLKQLGRIRTSLLVGIFMLNVKIVICFDLTNIFELFFFHKHVHLLNLVAAPIVLKKHKLMQ